MFVHADSADSVYEGSDTQANLAQLSTLYELSQRLSQADDLRATASGSGNYDLKGKVKSQTITISGVGNYTAGDLESSQAEVTVSGSGNVTLWVSEKLDIRVAGFGNVNYYGQPSVAQSITGGGGVKSLGTHN